MTKPVPEFRTGPLKSDKDFLTALQGFVRNFNDLVREYNKHVDTPLTFLEIVETPTTLSGYGIIDASPLGHRHDWSDIDGAPAAGTGIVAWSSITGKPFTVDGFGIVDASKIGHKHAYADILDPPPPGVGPPGPPGPPSVVPGPRGAKGESIPGLDGMPVEPMMIPGPPGRDGARGISPPPVIWFETAPAIEPPIVPGQRGSQGIQGNPGAPGVGGGSGGHEGVLAWGVIPPEPPFSLGVPGARGDDGLGFNFWGDWDPLSDYFPNDVIRYKGKLWISFKFESPAGSIPGVDPFWEFFLEDGRQGAIIPWAEPAQPIEPLMIPGRPGIQGPAGAGGSDPVQSSYAPGSFLVPTGKFAIFSKQLKLAGAERMTLQGTAHARLI